MRMETESLELESSLKLPQKQYFTLSEAESLLPQIEEHFLQILKLRDALQILQTIEIQFSDPFLLHAKDIRYTKEVHRLYLQLYNHLDALISLGCFVKDIEHGLIDFYAKKQGKDIFLCWKLGEPHIEHWHSLDNGFEKRKRIEDIKNFE